MKLSEIGEFGFIDRIKIKSRSYPGVILGIGDDAAVTAITPGMILLSTSDMLAEGIHFDLVWSDPITLGRKSLAVNLSDIAAMGGIPRFALLSLAIPPELPLDFIESFTDSFQEMAANFNVSLVGGDTSSSTSGLVISVTLLGEQFPDKVVKRNTACTGDIICVSGTAGDSSLGLKLLRSGSCSGSAVKCHLDPTPRVELGRTLAERGIATAMIDMSDGLLADLGHILEASSKGGRIYLERIPLSMDFKSHVAPESPDYYQLPLSGGEDYELIFTLPPSRLNDAEESASRAGISISMIGEITEESGLVIAQIDGSEYDAAFRGYDHFTRNRGRS